jgi:hypothetical protein
MGRGGEGGAMSDVERMLERLRAADSVPPARVAEAARSAWGRELLAAIVASPRAAGPPAARARSRRRLVAPLAIAAALTVAGGAIAAVTLREPPAEVRARIAEGLSLPAPDRAQLLPAPGGIREVLRAATPYGVWSVVRTRTEGGRELVSAIPVAPASLRRTGFGLAECDPARLPAGGSSLAPCTFATNTFAVPGLQIVGRAGPAVRGIRARYGDGRSVSGYVQNGFFLLLLPGPLRDQGARVPARLVPLDASGRELTLSARSAALVARSLGTAARFAPPARP